jgi:Tol biopolymer transport system component
MIIFSGIEGGHSVLQRVSVDGQTSQRLRADSADVREPVWAPFTRPQG